MKFKNDTINEIVTGAEIGMAMSLIVAILYGAIFYGPYEPLKFLFMVLFVIPMGVFTGSAANIFLSFAHFKSHPYKKSWSEKWSEEHE